MFCPIMFTYFASGVHPRFRRLHACSLCITDREHLVDNEAHFSGSRYLVD